MFLFIEINKLLSTYEKVDIVATHCFFVYK